MERRFRAQGGPPYPRPLDASFPQFMRFSKDLRRRIWEHACPELTALARVFSFEIQEENFGAPITNGTDFIFWSFHELQSQARDIRKLLEVHRETRELVQEVLPDTLDFKHRDHDYDTPINDPRSDMVVSVVNGRLYYRKETDIIWLNMPEDMEQFDFPPNLNNFRLGDGANEILNLGFCLPDGRQTLCTPTKAALTTHLLQQFPRPRNFFYGISAEGLQPRREHYVEWLFSHEDCHEYGFTFIMSTNNVDEGRDVIYRWPIPETIHQWEGLVPRVISKSVKPIEAAAEQNGWTLLPLLEVEDEFWYEEKVEEAQFSPHLPDLHLPSGSEMSEGEWEDVDDDMEEYSDEDDDTMSLNGEDDPAAHLWGGKPSKEMCGGRPDALPRELEDWGKVDPEKGYEDSDAGDPEDGSHTRTFHNFNDLPIELRWRIWETYCPDLTAPARVFELSFGCFRKTMAPQDVKAYEGVTTSSSTRKTRKVLAVNQESRALVLKALPDTLDFHIPPPDEIMKRGRVSEYPCSSLRFRKETDIIWVREPPDWEWEEEFEPHPRMNYTLPNFGNMVRNLAVHQPPNFMFHDHTFRDVEHLVRNLPRLDNLYYIIPPDHVSARNMTWALGPRTSRYAFTTVPYAGMHMSPSVEREICYWVAKDALPQIRLCRYMKEIDRRYEPIVQRRQINLLPMVVFDGRLDFRWYGEIVEEAEQARLRAERGEPEPELESDDEEPPDDGGVPLATVIGQIMDGTIPGGMPALADLLDHAGINTHALDEVMNAAQHNEWADEMDEDEDGYEESEDSNMDDPYEQPPQSFVHYHPGEGGTN